MDARSLGWVNGESVSQVRGESGFALIEGALQIRLRTVGTARPYSSSSPANS